jgi:hypothetical protein
MSRIRSLLLVLALAAQVPLASATVTYVVGTCQKTLYTSIQAALDATPSPNLVKICPGTYNEQIVITKPVTLEGISNGTSSGATIAVPSGGLVANATDSYGSSVAAQVLVSNVSGEVNLSNLTVDGTGNNSPAAFVVGVFYQNSPGTVNHLTAQNQNGSLNGMGVFLEGGSANPSVTVENSNVQGFDNAGIVAETNSTTSELTAAIDGNYLASSANLAYFADGIAIGLGGTISASGNLIAPGLGTGIYSFEGSVSKNTVLGVEFYGILTEFASVTSNTIFNTTSALTGAPNSLFVGSSTAPVTGNTIVQSAVFNAIDFDCVAGNNVHSNTIMGAGGGLINVPTSAVTANTYYNVGTIRSGGCP